MSCGNQNTSWMKTLRNRYCKDRKIYRWKGIITDIQIRYRFLLSSGEDKIRYAWGEGLDRKMNSL